VGEPALAFPEPKGSPERARSWNSRDGHYPSSPHGLLSSAPPAGGSSGAGEGLRHGNRPTYLEASQAALPPGASGCGCCLGSKMPWGEP